MLEYIVFIYLVLVKRKKEKANKQTFLGYDPFVKRGRNMFEWSIPFICVIL